MERLVKNGENPLEGKYIARIYLTTNLHYCVYVGDHPRFVHEGMYKLKSIYIPSDLIIFHDLQPSHEKLHDKEYIYRKVPKNIGDMIFSNDIEIINLGQLLLRNYLHRRELKYYNKLKK